MRRLTASWWLASLISAVGCSSSPKVKTEAVSGASPAPGGGFLIGDESVPGGSEAPPGDQGPACLGETRQAEAIGLDMYVMLDISESMLERLPSTPLVRAPPTKWDVVKQSLESFIRAPETADLGIGLQFFPQNVEGVPVSCQSNEECGLGAPCTTNLCIDLFAEDPPGPVSLVQYFAAPSNTPCASDADCAASSESCQATIGACVVTGVGPPPTAGLPRCNTTADCAGLPGTVCEEIRACEFLDVDLAIVVCTESIPCPLVFGNCTDFPHACLNRTSCEASDYQAPAVPISSAPARGMALITSLEAQIPNGRTPTGPALRGALEHARLWAEQNPRRQVVTVLATDGLPTECAPLEIPDIARLAGDANAGASPVRTFVIGVFSSGELGVAGRENLDALARAGGTNRAFVIDTSGNVGAEFLSALNLIRDSTVSCEFQLDGGAELDFDRVNLRVSDASGNVTDLLNVGDVTACGGDQGWYYVRNASGNPTQITVCPSTCAGFTAEGIQAELEIGCATRIR